MKSQTMRLLAIIPLFLSASISLAEQPQLHSLQSTAGTAVEAAVVGLSEDKKNVVLLVKKEIPLDMLSDQSRETIALLTHPDTEKREWANAPDFIRVPKSVDMPLSKYLSLPVAERISMVGTMLYISIAKGYATEELIEQVAEPQQLNVAAVQFEAFSIDSFRKLPPTTQFVEALGAFFRSEGVLKSSDSSAGEIR